MNRISFVIAGLLALSHVAYAAPSVRTRATDVIVLNNGWQLKGIVLTETPDPETVSLLVRSDWLTASLPQLAPSDAAAEHPAAAAANQIRHEIDRLKAAKTPDENRIGFLETRAKELDFLAENPAEEPNITILRVPKHLIRKEIRPPQSAREIGFYGILNNVTRTEELSPKRLRQKLEDLPEDSAIRTLPPADALSKDGLVRNVLLNADRQLGPSCQLIRIGETFIDAADERKMADVAVKILTEQLKTQLLSLDDNADARPDRNHVDQHQYARLSDAAIRMAREKSAATVDATEVRLNLKSGNASVRITLFHRANDSPAPNDRPDEIYEPVGSVTGTAGLADVPDERVEAIADDPRIRQALKLFEALGSRQQDVNRALKMGAVVEVAQQEAQRQLEDLIPPLLEFAFQPQVREITLDELPDE